MNYGQFLNMMPEAFLVLELIVMFIADFALMKSETKLSKLWTIAVGTLLFQTCLLFGTMEPTSAFGGLYISSQAINAMKIILTAGTLIVVMMSRGWLESKQVNKLTSGQVDTNGSSTRQLSIPAKSSCSCRARYSACT